MGRRVVALLGLVVMVAGSIIALRSAFAGEQGKEGPTAEHPLPIVLAEGDPAPTFTPLPAPSSDVHLITENKAIEIATELMSSQADEGPMRAVLGDVRDTGISLHDADYPVWHVAATGEFKPRSWKCCSSEPLFREATLYLDAVDGKVLGVKMRKAIKGDSHSDD